MGKRPDEPSNHQDAEGKSDAVDDGLDVPENRLRSGHSCNNFRAVIGDIKEARRRGWDQARQHDAYQSVPPDERPPAARRRVQQTASARLQTQLKLARQGSACLRPSVGVGVETSQENLLQPGGQIGRG